MTGAILLQSVEGNIDFTGIPFKIVDLNESARSIFTVSVTTHDFRGKVFVEASTVDQPTIDDWVAVPLDPATLYISYPIDSSTPTGENGGDTGNSTYSFFDDGFQYIRARVLRSDLDNENALSGDVSIILNEAEDIENFVDQSTSSTLPPITGFTQILNVGAGYQTYAGVNQYNIPTFRALAPGRGISIQQTSDTLRISATNNGNESIASTQGTFTDLTDVPSSYIGQANAAVLVNQRENALTFTQLSPVALSGLINDTNGVLSPIHGGTGLSSTTANSILTGLPNNAVGGIAAPTSANSYLTWTGSAFSWYVANTLSPIPARTILANSTSASALPVSTPLGQGLTLVNGALTASIDYSNLLNFPILATVATTGSYTDLTNQPEIFTLPVASSSILGGVKVDGTTITITSGVISSTSSLSASSINPLVDGTATPGSDTTYARGDHIHPTDSSRAPIISPTFTAGLFQNSAAVSTSDIDLDSASFFSKTISAATTFTVSNVPASGVAASFILEVTNGGAFTITWFANIRWPSAVVPALSASGLDVLGFYTSDGGSNWRGLLLGKGLA